MRPWFRCLLGSAALCLALVPHARPAAAAAFDEDTSTVTRSDVHNQDGSDASYKFWGHIAGTVSINPMTQDRTYTFNTDAARFTAEKMAGYDNANIWYHQRIYSVDATTGTIMGTLWQLAGIAGPVQIPQADIRKSWYATPGQLGCPSNRRAMYRVTTYSNVVGGVGAGAMDADSVAF